MPKIVIDSNNFLRGMSSSDFSQDGGFSPLRGGYNLDAYRNDFYGEYPYTGLLCSLPALTVATGTTTDEVCCFVGGTNGLGEAFLMVDEDGKFYSLAGNGNITLKQTDSTRTYNDYKTDGVYYGGSFYVNSTTDIAKLNSSLSTIDQTWWTVTNSRASLNSFLPTAFLDFNGYLYIGNDGDIWTYNGTTISSVMTLLNEYKVLAMEVHGGRIYISVERAINASGGYHARDFKILVWDGVSPTFDNEFTLPVKTYTIKSVNGRLYFFTTNYLGVWNGIGLTPIFFYGPNTNPQPYKQTITTYQNRLYFMTHGKNIICYDGTKFYKLFDVNSSSTFTDDYLTGMFCGANDSLVFTGRADRKMYVMELDQFGNGGFWPSLRYQFDDETWIRKVRVFFQEETDTTTTTAFYYNDEKSNDNSIGALASEEVYLKEFTLDKQVREFQLYVNFGTTPKPIKSIIIEYEK